MSHQVGGLPAAPHGVVDSVLLPHAIRYNAQAVPNRFVALAAAVSLKVDGMPGQDAAELLAQLVGDIADECGVPPGLQDLQLLARGLSNRAIGRRLYISETTAKFHVGNIMRKLEVSRRAEAVYEASKLGMI